MECPSCKRGCVLPAERVLAGLERLYMACPDCAPDPSLDKSMPLKELPKEAERCGSCGRAPLDVVMLEALEILEEHGLRDKRDNLRSVGSPLIVVGYPVAYPPRLGPRSLIIHGERLDREVGEEMVRRVPEVKGVILGRGIAGFADGKPNASLLLAGCDLRADVVQSLLGELVIYKSQSKVHIEFPRQGAPKIRMLERLWLDGKLRDVADGLSGPGTLGLTCILAGAERVVLNDIWLPAVENVLLNLNANRGLLGLEGMEHLETPRGEVGGEPVLVGRAWGSCEVEVYHGDLARLFSRARPARLCLIDQFPGLGTRELEEACRCCGEVVIV